MTATDFIKAMIDAHHEVTVFLGNGIRMKGRIYYQDDVSILMSNYVLTDKRVLIFKNAISTIYE